MDDFGPCERCGEPSVVRINKLPFCEAHIDEGMAEAFDPVRRIIKVLEGH